MICIVLALALAAGLSACGKGEPEAAQTTLPDAQTSAETIAPTAEPTEATAAQSTVSDTTTLPPEYAGDATRTLAYYAGVYGAGRCTVRIEPVSDSEAKVSIVWGDSAFEAYEWEMTGYFNPDTYRLTYSDCVKTDVVFAEDGSETRTVLYEDGVGRFQLQPDHSMEWQDEQDNAGEDMEFVYSPAS